MLGLALKNMLRNRRRTLLTVLSVTVSTLLLGVLPAVYSAFYLRASYEEQAIRLVVRHKVSYMLRLPEYYEDRIREIPGVEETCVFDYFQGTAAVSQLMRNATVSLPQGFMMPSWRVGACVAAALLVGAAGAFPAAVGAARLEVTAALRGAD